MWIFVLYSLALAHGTLAEVDCSKDAYDECEAPAIFSFVPTDVSEYNRLCPIPPNSELELHPVSWVVATENLRCFNETFRTTSCPEKMKAVTGPYRSPRLNTEDEDDYSLPIEVMCLQDILESNCIAAEVGKNCGQEALEATLEFFRRSFYIEDTCGKRNAEDLLKNLDKYKLDKDQKALVIATLEKVIISAKK
ncbi:hypothetical protein AVEN_158096-1 [Araneus ventricosus]|uniref:DUF19 domain-containing protein n=1 Tax=Araneus ventricosus TaxID=182803 RepID=A0A4Y2HTN1_ARAVE|nr:hypothetical protein AVEN_158096-1 [Araneus ventricosus]